MTYKIFNTKTNSRGVRYGMAKQESTGLFGVYKLCNNYCSASLKTGITSAWRYVEKDMLKDAAETLFARRTK